MHIESITAPIQSVRILYTPVIRVGDTVTISPPYTPRKRPGTTSRHCFTGPFEVLRVLEIAGFRPDGSVYMHKTAVLHIPGIGRGRRFPLTRLERA